MNDPLVSIHMITYNHAPYIAEAIEGILHQKVNFPFELVIGEDCSTDGTREIAVTYKNKYPGIIKLITSDSNVGMKKNAYRTGKACNGKYIAFCEGDDYWQNTDKLQIQADYLENHPECGLVYSDYAVYHVETSEKIENYIRYRKWKIPENITISEILSHQGGILTCTVMMKRDLFDKIIESDPYIHQDEYFLMGDIQIWAEASTMAKIHYIPESTATHKITAESVSRSNDIKKILRFAISGCELLIYLCKKYNLPDNIREKNETGLNNASLHYAFYSGDIKLAEEAKSRKKKLSFKERIWYLGVKNRLIYYIFYAIAATVRFFKPKYGEWR
jgi:glycosyltransferase involved in cell wall biosynthesis